MCSSHSPWDNFKNTLNPANLFDKEKSQSFWDPMRHFVPEPMKAPEVPDPIKPPEKQAEKLPDQQAARRAKQNARRQGLPGPNDTWLTGPGGVSASSLNLGSTTLLGR